MDIPVMPMSGRAISSVEEKAMMRVTVTCSFTWLNSVKVRDRIAPRNV